MTAGPKTNLDVRLLGLDEKANPRTAIPGTIVDGLNWKMDKDGRVEKRAGSAALAMLDTSAATVSGARELSHLGDELLLSNRRKLYGRDANTGEWIPRGRAALERLSIQHLTSTNVACNGVDSSLQLDCAVIGNYVLTIMARTNITSASDPAYRWIVSDKTTGRILSTNTAPYIGYALDTDGTDDPTFVTFAVSYNVITAGVWSADFSSVSWVNLANDISQAPDRNPYDVDGYGWQGAPFGVVRVAANTWLLAYQTNAKYFVVRKVTRTSGTSFTVSSAATVSGGNSPWSMAFAWSFVPGDTSAYVVGLNGVNAPLLIIFAQVAISTGAVVATSTTDPDAWNIGSVRTPRCRALTGASFPSFLTPIFLFDVEPAEGGRHVYSWSPSQSDATIVARNTALLTHAWAPSDGESNELCVGVAHLSTWQPSSFVLRMLFTSGSMTAFSIGAHLQAGDSAGRQTSCHLPRADFGVFPLGTLSNPEYLGGPGTVNVKLAQLPSDTYTTAGPPVEIAESLVMPGGIFKAYDGFHVTEAAFPLGPDSLTAVESTRGITYTATTAGVLTTELGNQLADEIEATFDGSGDAIISLTTAAGEPGVASWPAGVVLFDFWIKVSDPTPAVTYYLERGGGTHPLMIKQYGGASYWQTAGSTQITITDSWQHLQYSIPVSAITLTTADRLQINITVSAPPADGATVHMVVGGAQAPTFTAPYPVLENGARQYCACLSWTDGRGRLQRSQICPPVSLTTAAGLATTVTIPTVTITERDGLTNLDTEIHPASVEIYRTEVNGEIFYRVGSVENDVNGDDLSYTDDTPDTEITDNEELYTTGNLVEVWPPIGGSLAESHQGRLFVCDAEGKVWFTAYIQDGESLAFAAEYQVESAHIPRPLTALLSLDDKLAICSEFGVASLVGIGPETSGLPAYDSPMMLSTGFGPLSRRACARTPAGWEIVTAHGMCLLDRGLSLLDMRSQVTDDVPGSSTWNAAIYDPNGTGCRFSTSELVIAHDTTLPPPPSRAAQWFRWSYPYTVVAFASSDGEIYMLGSDGTVYQADSGLSDAGTAFQQWLQFAVVSPAGPNGFARVHAMRFMVELAAGSTFKVTFGSEEGRGSTPSDDTTLAGALTGFQDIIAKPKYGKVSSITVWVGESAATATTGFTLDAIGMLVGSKRGVGHLPTANRMGRS